MSRLHDLYSHQAQSPWLDNLRREWLHDGTLDRWLDRGVRGMTSNPTIFQKAVAGGSAYDDQITELAGREVPAGTMYWELVVADIVEFLDRFRPLYDEAGGSDGFVSLELSPELARDTRGSVEACHEFHDRIARPNLLVKIPGTAEGVPAVHDSIAGGRSVNITLLFSVERYGEVIEAYLSGLEACDGDLGGVHSVASFFLSRVDTEVDRRLDAIGSPEALALRGRAAVAQAKLAYQLFRERFSGDRWQALAARGARVQRPLWASTSTKNPAYPDLLYVETIIGPDTVNTMPDTTLDAFDDHGTVGCTVDDGVADARAHLDRVQELGVDMEDVARVLEEEGVAAFAKSFDEMVSALESKAASLS